MKRASRHGVVGVARLELTELVGRVAWLRYLFEPAAGASEWRGSGGRRQQLEAFPDFHRLTRLATSRRRGEPNIDPM